MPNHDVSDGVIAHTVKNLRGYRPTDRLTHTS